MQILQALATEGAKLPHELRPVSSAHTQRMLDRLLTRDEAQRLTAADLAKQIRMLTDCNPVAALPVPKKRSAQRASAASADPAHTTAFASTTLDIAAPAAAGAEHKSTAADGASLASGTQAQTAMLDISQGEERAGAPKTSPSAADPSLALPPSAATLTASAGPARQPAPKAPLYPPSSAPAGPKTGNPFEVNEVKRTEGSAAHGKGWAWSATQSKLEVCEELDSACRHRGWLAAGAGVASLCLKVLLLIHFSWVEACSGTRTRT